MQKTPFVILGLLGRPRRQARSGYEIKKAIDTVISHFWSESNGQIYPVLRQLSADGSIHAKAKKGKGRRKILYAITAKGEASLRAWMKASPETGRLRDELILKLFFGSERDIPALICHLEERRAREKAVLGQCLRWQKEIETQRTSHSAYHLITLRAGISLTETSLRWVDESLATLSQIRSAKRRRPSPALRSSLPNS
jgi:PadR family transcriptional regulator AphA